MPPAPRSPSPSIRSPSVTTIAADHVEPRMSQNTRQTGFIRQAEEQAARLAVDMAEPLAADADRRRVDDWQHLFEVLRQEAVECRLVVVLQVSQEVVLLEARLETAHCIEATRHLLVERSDVRRQQPVQLEGIPFGFREGNALVQDWVIKEFIARSPDRHWQPVRIPDILDEIRY